MKIWGFILALALSLPLLGQQENVAKAAEAPAAEEVKKLELDLAALQVKGDWEQYASHLTDDYVRTSSDGGFESKDEILAEFRSGKAVLLDTIPEELQVRLHGDSAVLTGHMTALTRQNGRITTLFTRFTEVFVRRDGAWWLAAGHATRVLK